MHHLARLIRRLMAGSFGLGLALFLGGQVAFAAPPPMGGMNTISVNQSIAQNAPSTATASAVNNGRGSAFAFANASPRQVASQQSFVSANAGPFIRHRSGPMSPGGMNTISVNQSIAQNAPSTATASAVNNGRGRAFAFANASPRQVASQRSVIRANAGPVGMHPHVWGPSGSWNWWR